MSNIDDVMELRHDDEKRSSYNGFYCCDKSLKVSLNLSELN
ncbi:hypothetical protein ACWEYC_06610 [Staphylococcus xylosus]|nr:hypothetical protein [Staphylococcus xylosus]